MCREGRDALFSREPALTVNQREVYTWDHFRCHCCTSYNKYTTQPRHLALTVHQREDSLEAAAALSFSYPSTCFYVYLKGASLLGRYWRKLGFGTPRSHMVQENLQVAVHDSSMQSGNIPSWIIELTVKPNGGFSYLVRIRRTMRTRRSMFKGWAR